MEAPGVPQVRGAVAGTAPSRRQLLALAGALTVTVLTVGAAVAGLTRHPSTPAPVVPTVDRIQAPTPTLPVEPGD